MSVWDTLHGRDLDEIPYSAACPPIWALVNIWNDLESLRKNIHTWLPYVDRVILLDGAYHRMGPAMTTHLSTDGLEEYVWNLNETQPVPVEYYRSKVKWSQIDKRNWLIGQVPEKYFAFVPDADESYTNMEGLKPYLSCNYVDVGWARCSSPMYARNQDIPKLFRVPPSGIRYKDRHYHMYTGNDHLLTTFQLAGDQAHRLVPLSFTNNGEETRSKERDFARRLIKTNQSTVEAKVGGDPPTAREPLRIIGITPRDAGVACSRFHTAINATTPHTSLYACKEDGNPLWPRSQFWVKKDSSILREAIKGADIVHCHLRYEEADILGSMNCERLVIHHHGTLFRLQPDYYATVDPQRAGLRLVSNVGMLKYADDLHWLPNPIPVMEYYQARKQLYKPDPEGFLRVGHSPSWRAKKGTDVFLQVMHELQMEGVKVKAVLMENMTHDEVIRTKASEVDLFFDSFDQGIQCSGLEMAAMGVEVLAGDKEVWDAYSRIGSGLEPYVYVDKGTLKEKINHYTSTSFSRPPLRYPSPYVVRYHSYGAVSRRYLDLLDQAFGWRGV